MAKKKKSDSRERYRKHLEGRRRHDIRYTLYRIQNGTEYDDDMPFPELVEPVKRWYRPQVMKFGIDKDKVWKAFSSAWDVGNDEAEVIVERWNNYLHSQWYTFGISRLVAVKNPGQPVIDIDGVPSVVTPAKFFAVRGYADYLDKTIIPNVGKILEDSESRLSWV